MEELINRLGTMDVILITAVSVEREDRGTRTGQEGVYGVDWHFGL